MSMRIRFLHHERGVTVSAFIQGGAMAGLTGDAAYNKCAALRNLRLKVERAEDDAKSLIDEAMQSEVKGGFQ